MANELVINTIQNSYRIALLRQGEVLEYHIDKEDNPFTVGDIYLGTVKKLVPGLNASFIDIGYTKDAFLHYSDLGIYFNSLHALIQVIKKQEEYPDFSHFVIEPALDKLGKITNVLSKDQLILVQIVKEPISNKGPRLSTELSLAGRYMILIPFSNTIHISSKITNSKERERLQRLVKAIKPTNFGIIIRTAAEKVEVAKLDKDLKELVERWHVGLKRLKIATSGDRIIGEVSRTYTILRDVLNEFFDSITVDDKRLYTEMKQYIQHIAPEKEKIVKFYQGKKKLFEHFGIEKQLKMLFGQTVNMQGGGYLVIEHTEAMHVIDVNSGNKVTANGDQEGMALEINLAAAQEIARQLRLRDMGGIIVVDFIDIRNLEHKRQLYQAMKEYMKEDRAKVSILPLSKFGVMQITRQRVRPQTHMITKERCPACGGSGKIGASIAISDQIEQHLKLIVMQQNERNITLFVHPYLYAYFTKGCFSQRFKWFLQYKKWIKLAEDSSLGVTDFQFMNQRSEVIELN